MVMVLYTFWRSQAAFRVRIALRMKSLEAEMRYVDLLKGEQLADGYRALNPAMVLPTLLIDDEPPLVQSLAILEYLNERYPTPPLLPADPFDRAHVRAVAQMVATDAHPLIVPRVRNYLEHELHLDEQRRTKWLRHWLDNATRAVEDLLSRDQRTGQFSYGDQATMADICLFTHLTSAKMLHGCDLEPFPTVKRIYEACGQVEAFALAHPFQQPDAPRAS
jgi:maleylacetoacetate isomerase